jgi:hypothetical protein
VNQQNDLQMVRFENEIISIRLNLREQ